MTAHLPVRDNRPNDELHPLIYQSLIGLTIWLVLSAWGLFSRGAYEGLTLSVITLFFVILFGIRVLLWLTWRRNIDPNEQHTYSAIHSITSSARPISVLGTLRPSVLAVFK